MKVFGAVVLSLFVGFLLFHLATGGGHGPGRHGVGTDRTRAATAAEFARLGGDVFHPAVGLVVLVVVLVLNVYKARGMTAYGQRKRCEERTAVPTPVG